jgi:hypothetical protein
MAEKIDGDIGSGFTITDKRRGTAPTSHCSGCGSLINDIYDGGIVWDTDTPSPHSARLLCKHNGCLERHNGDWKEMRDYVLDLLFNCGVKTKEQFLEVWGEQEHFADYFAADAYANGPEPIESLLRRLPRRDGFE